MDDQLFDLPPEHEAGVYANTFSVWHTDSEFTLDFAVNRSSDEGTLVVVSRVRIPTTSAFALIQMINGDLADFEKEWGEIVIPRKNHPEGT